MKLKHALLTAWIGLHGMLFVMLADARSPVSAIALTQTRTTQTLSKVVDMSGAILERKLLLSGSLKISYISATQSGAVSVQTITLGEHPLWVVFEEKWNTVHAVVDAERIKQYLISYPVPGIHQAQACSILSTHVDEEGVIRAETDCTAKSGYTYDIDELATAIKEALETQQGSIEFMLTPATASITDLSGATLSLLSTGHSTFEGSGLGRKANVRKALNERVNNVIVPAGAVFSFNDTLGNVSTSNGWQMALTIFEGVNLRPAPGGGICQASTTTYRAALAAGFPILEQKNHSLYVHYYEKYGVGQDATVFPGKQNMKFLNDSGAPLLIQAYNDGDDAYVQIYGHDDGRRVTIKGPYFSKTMTENILEGDKKLHINEIGWVRTITTASGEDIRNVFVARYKALPKSLAGRSPTETVVSRAGNVEGEIISSL